jgi:hypothetical protein
MSENNISIAQRFEKIDATVAKLLDILYHDLELGLEDDIVVALKLLLYFLNIIQQKATTREEKEIVRQVKAQIIEYIGE